MRKRITLILAIMILGTVVVALPATAGEGAVVIPFEKELIGTFGTTMVWEGTVGVGGGLRTFLARDEIREAGKTWHVSFDWYASDPTFVAEVEGTINLRNGRVAMSGWVTSGVYEGSRIIVRATLDLTDLSSEGTMLITPSG